MYITNHNKTYILVRLTNILMAQVNNFNYVTRTTSEGVERNWWIGTYEKHNVLKVHIKTIKIPKRLVGKKLRFKVEVVENG